MHQRHGVQAAAISLIATLLTLYALEAVLAFANPSWVDKLGTTLRRGPSVVDETLRFRASHAQAFPFLQPDTYLDSSNQSLLSISGTNTIPLSGSGNTLTILCNESGTTIGYRSDSLGFRNPQNVWEPISQQPEARYQVPVQVTSTRQSWQHPDAALIGDSFTHGFCRPEPETIAAKLRASGKRVINAGLTGAGPLAELGILREFISSAKPKHVYWLFYEGHDLIDIASEQKTALVNYLKPDYSQHLLERHREVDSAIRDFSNALLARHRAPSTAQRLWSFVLLRKLRTATGLYRQPSTPVGDENDESAVLRSVLEQADLAVKAWGGQLTLVYLPERRRFNKRTAPVTGEHHDPRMVQQRVKDITTRLGIPILDVVEVFAREEDPAKLWNSRRYHYNADGYELVAQTIADDLAKH